MEANDLLEMHYGTANDEFRARSVTADDMAARAVEANDIGAELLGVANDEFDPRAVTAG